MFPQPTYTVTILNIRTGNRRTVTTYSLEGAEQLRTRHQRGRTVVAITAN